MQNDDVNYKGLVIFLGILAVTLMIFYFALGAMWRTLEKEAQERDAQAAARTSPPSVAASQPYFPEPREQPNPAVDTIRWRAQEAAEINSYGWIDRSNGIVRIPIDRAIELLSEPERKKP